jgi:hypothetical protein
MSKLITLRNNTSLYVTNDQADGIFDEVNSNPNLRMLRVLTGQGYQYFPPSSIVAITPCYGESYKSDKQIEDENKRALKTANKQITNSMPLGYLEG